ncbi:hypothetical protein DPEC_G00158150, partial [Dallia pectoralis]
MTDLHQAHLPNQPPHHCHRMGIPYFLKRTLSACYDLGQLSAVAPVLQISRPTLYKFMRQYNIRHTKYCEISDEELDATISDIKAEHPHVEEVMLNGHLRARDMVVQRHHLRDSEKG